MMVTDSDGHLVGSFDRKQDSIYEKLSQQVNLPSWLRFNATLDCIICGYCIKQMYVTIFWGSFPKGVLTVIVYLSETEVRKRWNVECIDN